MRFIASIFRGIRYLLWVPFAIMASPAVFVLVLVGAYLYQPETWPFACIAAILMCGLSMPIERTLRPSHRPALKHPPREKPILLSRARIAVRAKGRAASIRRIMRSIPPELRVLVADRAMPEPEAILHDRQRAAALTKAA